MEARLAEIRESLLRGLRVESPDSLTGDLAFEHHILLAVRFHRAAGLNQTGHGELAGWELYFSEHFPKGSNWRPEDATLLFEKWRNGLVKHETLHTGVTATHGQPQAHWWREPSGSLCINLESMWDDFEESVASFIRLLENDETRREEAVRRWLKRSWTVRKLVAPAGHYLDHDVSAARSVTATTMSSPPTIIGPSE